MILVVGVDPEGTTEVARILEQRFGVRMGGQPNYEQAPHVAADRAFVRGDISVKDWATAIQAFAAEAEEPFGFKHPLGAGIVSGLISMFPDAKIIWVQRDLVECVNAWHASGVDDYTAVKATLMGHEALSATLPGIPHMQITTDSTEADLVELLAEALDMEPLEAAA